MPGRNRMTRMKPRLNKQQVLNLLPDSVLMTRGPRASRAYYLTFDDGPHPEHTPRLLDLLARHGAHASFFVIGREAEKHPALLERIVAEGHLLGNHSFNHNRFAQLPLREQLAEIARTDQVLQAFDNRSTHRMRPPQGRLTFPLMLHFGLRRRGITHWSYDSLDYRHPSPDAVVARFLERSPAPREIILMHDDAACAVDALQELLPRWRDDGWTFDALPAERA